MERLLRWLVLLTLLAAFLAVHTDAVKATSLIFGKTSTTSTEAPLDEEPSANGDET
uniref:Secreted protein n=1 Tax=Lutzomyia longipalpis TaxID=7200 RepID=A0A1B0CBQ4_LUTLO